MKFEKEPRIANYDHYSDFLQDLCASGGHGTKAKLAATLGIKNSYLSAVLLGKTNLSLEQGERLADFLGLNEKETDYLFLLLQSARAGTPTLRRIFEEKRKKLKKTITSVANKFEGKKIREEELREVYYSHSLHSILHMIGTMDNGLSPKEIRGKLAHFMPALEECLQNLLRLNLLYESEGKIRARQSLFMLQNGAKEIWRLHQNFRALAQSLLQRQDKTDFSYSAAASLAPEDVEKIKTILRNALAKANETVLAATQTRQVHLLTIDFLRVI